MIGLEKGSHQRTVISFESFFCSDPVDEVQERSSSTEVLNSFVSLLPEIQPAARFINISNAGNVLPSSTSKNAPPPVEM